MPNLPEESFTIKYLQQEFEIPSVKLFKRKLHVELLSVSKGHTVNSLMDALSKDEAWNLNIICSQYGFASFEALLLSEHFGDIVYLDSVQPDKNGNQVQIYKGYPHSAVYHITNQMATADEIRASQKYVRSQLDINLPRCIKGKRLICSIIADISGNNIDQKITYQRVQEEYSKIYGTILNDAKIFGRSKAVVVFEKICCDEIQITIDQEKNGVIYLQLKKPLEELEANWRSIEETQQSIGNQSSNKLSISRQQTGDHRINTNPPKKPATIDYADEFGKNTVGFGVESNRFGISNSNRNIDQEVANHMSTKLPEKGASFDAADDYTTDEDELGIFDLAKKQDNKILKVENQQSSQQKYAIREDNNTTNEEVDIFGFPTQKPEKETLEMSSKVNYTTGGDGEYTDDEDAKDNRSFKELKLTKKRSGEMPKVNLNPDMDLPPSLPQSVPSVSTANPNESSSKWKKTSFTGTRALNNAVDHIRKEAVRNGKVNDNKLQQRAPLNMQSVLIELREKERLKLDEKRKNQPAVQEERNSSSVLQSTINENNKMPYQIPVEQKNFVPKRNIELPMPQRNTLPDSRSSDSYLGLSSENGFRFSQGTTSRADFTEFSNPESSAYRPTQQVPKKDEVIVKSRPESRHIPNEALPQIDNDDYYAPAFRDDVETLVGSQAETLRKHQGSRTDFQEFRHSRRTPTYRRSTTNVYPTQNQSRPQSSRATHDEEIEHSFRQLPNQQPEHLLRRISTYDERDLPRSHYDQRPYDYYQPPHRIQDRRAMPMLPRRDVDLYSNNGTISDYDYERSMHGFYNSRLYDPIGYQSNYRPPSRYHHPMDDPYLNYHPNTLPSYNPLPIQSRPPPMPPVYSRPQTSMGYYLPRNNNLNSYELSSELQRLSMTLQSIVNARAPNVIPMLKLYELSRNVLGENFVDPRDFNISWEQFVTDYSIGIDMVYMGNQAFVGKRTC